MIREGMSQFASYWTDLSVKQEEGNESQDGEDMEGEVEYLEVEELEDMEYRGLDDYEDKPDIQHMH